MPWRTASRASCASASELGEPSHEVPRDLQGCRGGGRRGVEQVHDPPVALDEEVVDEGAVGPHRLGSHPRPRRHEVGVTDVRHEPAHALREALC
jgi:hypothetical protein